MRLLLVALFSAVWAIAQDGAALGGPYHFVRITVREEAPGKLMVRSGGGTIAFDKQGAYRMKGHAGTNRENALPLERSGIYSMGAESRVTLSGLWDPKESIEARAGDGGAMLIGAAAQNAKTYDLFVAARASESPGASSMTGTYAGGYLAVVNGEAGGLTSGYTEMTTSTPGKWTGLFAIAHTADVDDVNRREEAKDVAYAIGADGLGKTTFANLDDSALTGEHVLLLSRDAELLLGYATGAGRRQVMALVKKPAEQVTWMFTGPYWIAEIGAESPYKFQPSAVRFASGTGLLRAGGDGFAAIAERMNAGGRPLRLTTLNQYRIGTDGSSAFGPKVTNTQRNFAVNEGARMFSGAEVGAAGELTLQHGIVVGVKATGASEKAFPQLPRNPIGSGMPMRADFRLITPTQPAKAGETIVMLVTGIGPGKPGAPVQVLFGGKPGEVKFARCVAEIPDLWLINVVVPAEVAGTAVPLVVRTADAMVDLVDIAIAK